MANSAGLVELKKNQKATDAVCHLVALTLPNGFIRKQMEQDFDVVLNIDTVSKLKNSKSRPAWMKTVARKKEQILQGFKEMDPMFMPHLQAMACFEVGRYGLNNGDPYAWYKAIETVNKWVLGNCAGYQLLKEYTSEAILKHAGIDPKAEGERTETETISFEVVMKRVRQVRAQGMEAVKKLLPADGEKGEELGSIPNEGNK